MEHVKTREVVSIKKDKGTSSKVTYPIVFVIRYQYINMSSVFGAFAKYLDVY